MPIPPDEPRPVLGTWPRMYLAVLLYLIALILFFYWFTKAFNR